MSVKYEKWICNSPKKIAHNLTDLEKILRERCNLDTQIELDYGTYGLTEALNVVLNAIRKKKKIALYADYDVDGTMSCVSWIWFLESISYHNFVYHIPDT